MRASTPPLDTPAKRAKYLKEHLFNELRWMLAAATEWNIQKVQLGVEIGGYHVDVFAMDSACLHARTLFEFFLNKTKGNYYGHDQFLKAELKSDNYTKDWSGPLHSHLMHAQDRSRPRQLQTPDGLKDLNQMPVHFAKEVLRLWKEFEEALKQQDKSLGQLARDKRKEAIDNAECVVRSCVAQKYASDKQINLRPVFEFD
jgi:hypothetical protein